MVLERKEGSSETPFGLDVVICLLLHRKVRDVFRVRLSNGPNIKQSIIHQFITFHNIGVSTIQISTVVFFIRVNPADKGFKTDKSQLSLIDNVGSINIEVANWFGKKRCHFYSGKCTFIV